MGRGSNQVVRAGGWPAARLRAPVRQSVNAKI